jgi:teichuronic acid biosynthesis protein TuaF
MSLFENESVSRILTRFKRLFLLLLLIPVLLAVLGYFIEMNQETTSQAKAEIMLGDHYHTKYTEVGAVQAWLKSEQYLNKLKKDFNKSYNAEELAGKINTTLKSGKVIELSYSANNKEKADKVLTELVDAFLSRSDKVYENKKNSLEDQKLETNDELTLYEINSKLEDLIPTQIHMDVKVEESSNNPMRRAILGFLIGTMFSISILLAPEVFRK